MSDGLRASGARRSATGVAVKGRSQLARIRRTCRGNSFDGETPVLMSDGTQKSISQVEVGDLVWATDPVTGFSAEREVMELIQHSGPHLMVIIQLVDGTQIEATDQHPFWVAGGPLQLPPVPEWTAAADLSAGTRLLDPLGAELVIESVALSSRELTAYNLSVEDLHTYYVGNSPVLVHNCGDDDAAKALGYYRVRGIQSHGQNVYMRGRGAKGPKVISRDADKHRGGIWKGANSVQDLLRGRRTGTYDKNLKKIAK